MSRNTFVIVTNADVSVDSQVACPKGKSNQIESTASTSKIFLETSVTSNYVNQHSKNLITNYFSSCSSKKASNVQQNIDSTKRHVTVSYLLYL